MTSSSSLPTSKSQFLTSQIRLLSSPLSPSTTFTETYLSPSTSNSNGKKKTNHKSTLNDTSALDSTINETTNPLDDQDEHEPEHEADSTLQSLPNNPNSNKPNQSEAALAPAQLAHILDKVNAKITAHNKRVFPSISQRHIIEQIEGLYLYTALDGVEGDDDDITQDAEDENADGREDRTEREREREQGRNQSQRVLTAVTRDTDLTSTSTITALPESLQSTLLHPKPTTTNQTTNTIPSTQQNTYQSLHTQLHTLSGTRDTLLKAQATYNKLQILLSPFSDPKMNVQGNIVGIREEEGLQREMERLRVLVARVVGSLNREGAFRGDQRRGDAGTVESGGAAEGRTVDERLKMILEMGEDKT